MSQRAEALAQRLEQGAAALRALASTLTAEEWRGAVEVDVIPAALKRGS